MRKRCLTLYLNEYLLCTRRLLVGFRVKPYHGKFLLEVENDIDAPDLVDICQTYLDNLTEFVPKKFANAGYATLMSDDWPAGILRWPFCVGFANKSTHHNLRLFYFFARL